MNKKRILFIIFLIFALPTLIIAQNADDFSKQYITLLEKGDHQKIVELFNDNSAIIEASNAIDRFIYYIILVNSQIIIDKQKEANETFSKCTHALGEMDSSTLQLVRDNDMSKLLLSQYYYFLGKRYLDNGYNHEAEENLSESLNILRTREDREQIKLYRDIHLQFGLLYLNLNNMSRALGYFNDVKLGSEANLWFDNNYCKAIMMAGLIYLNRGEYIKAKMYFDETQYTIENNFNRPQNGDEHLIKVMLCSCYLQMGYKDEAKNNILKGISDCERNNSSETSLSIFLSLLGTITLNNGDSSSAKAIYKKAYDLVYTKERTDFKRLIQATNLAIVQYLTNDSKYKKTIANLSFEVIDDIIRQFSFLSSDERARYWDKQSDYLNKFNAMLFKSDDNDYYDQIYNNTIFLKGLLLRTNNKISNELAKSKDTGLKRDALKLQELQYKALNEEMEPEQLNTIRNSIRQIEKKLAVKFIGYQSYESIYKQYNYKTIKESLGNNEAAIEFIKIPELTVYTDSLKEYYAAIVFKQNYTHPKIIQLCSDSLLEHLKQMPQTFKEKEFQENSRNEIYRQYLYGSGEYSIKKGKTLKFNCIGDSLYKYIWEPLESQLKDVSTVYYSTSGQLNEISFNALPIHNGNLSEKYDLYSLSSTSEIPDIKTRVNIKPKSAILYGGINYDTNEEEMLSKSNLYNIPKSKINNYATITRGERGSWRYLAGSEKEVNDISAKLTASGIDNKLFSSSDANEESFKATSGNSPSLFHIATHGFYYSDSKNNGIKKFLYSIKGLNNISNMEEALSRSGILFSGANRVWIGESKNDRIEDGILTAEEISHLDLSKTDMVVLSACETALGKNIGPEGIFGLQRAFKLAGVKTIVMSLWKVPDSETSQLMYLFYTNWIGGMEKHKAFQLAQRKIKETYTNPYFWAGFIMLD